MRSVIRVKTGRFICSLADVKSAIGISFSHGPSGVYGKELAI